MRRFVALDDDFLRREGPMPAEFKSTEGPAVPSAFQLANSDDWRALLRTRANVLITGPRMALTAFVYAAQPEFRQPIRSVNCSALCLIDTRTMILLDVEALDTGGQQQLIGWMNEPRNTDTQIISLAGAPLSPLVKTHAFDAELYYRLNVIYLEMLGLSSRVN